MTAPTRRDYRDADRLLKARTSIASPDYDPHAAVLRCWIEDTKPERRPDLAYYIWGGVFTLGLLAGLLLPVGAR